MGREARRRATGQSLVDFAIALPLLVLVLLGMVQFAVWYHGESVVLAAVREGAHAAALEGGIAQDGVDTARRLVTAGLGRYGAGVTVEAAVDAEVARVVAEGRLPAIVPLPGLPDGLPLRARATAYREGFRP
jgi:Flp pilus assembly protein TadG